MRLLVFPVSMLVIYGMLFVIMPNKALVALIGSSRVFLNILVPLCLVFIFMVVLNLFIKPESMVKFLGRGAGVKGVILSATAGIVSMGPIYAWYPILKTLREKGAENGLIAIFLVNRSVKPFLFPIMISYFGWSYVLILTIFTIFGSVGVGYCIDVLAKEHP